MYQTLLLPDKYDKIRKTIKPVIYKIMEEIISQKTEGIETFQLIYELDSMGKLTKTELIKFLTILENKINLIEFLRSKYDIDQLKNYINEDSDDTEIMLQIIRLNNWDDFERLDDMNKIQTLTNLELIEFLNLEVLHEMREADDSNDASD